MIFFEVQGSAPLVIICFVNPTWSLAAKLWSNSLKAVSQPRSPGSVGTGRRVDEKKVLKRIEEIYYGWLLFFGVFMWKFVVETWIVSSADLGYLRIYWNTFHSSEILKGARENPSTWTAIQAIDHGLLPSWMRLGLNWVRAIQSDWKPCSLINCLYFFMRMKARKLQKGGGHTSKLTKLLHEQ
jgi:hypothetical protein